MASKMVKNVDQTADNAADLEKGNVTNDEYDASERL